MKLQPTHPNINLSYLLLLLLLTIIYQSIPISTINLNQQLQYQQSQIDQLILQLFIKYDTDQDRFLSLDELKSYLRFSLYSYQQLEQKLAKHDQDGNHMLDLEEFSQLIDQQDPDQYIEQLRQFDNLEIQSIVRQYDQIDNEVDDL